MFYLVNTYDAAFNLLPGQFQSQSHLDSCDHNISQAVHVNNLDKRVMTYRNERRVSDMLIT